MNGGFISLESCTNAGLYLVLSEVQVMINLHCTSGFLGIIFRRPTRILGLTVQGVQSVQTVLGTVRDGNAQETSWKGCRH